MTRSNLAKSEFKRNEEQREIELKQLRETLKVASSLENEVRQMPQREVPKSTPKKG